MSDPGRIPADLSVVQALGARRSIRRFLPNPVPESTIQAILHLAARSASGVNMQPWRVHVATGDARERLGRGARAAMAAGEAVPEYAYLPATIPEPYSARRRKVGYDLYAQYGIARDDYPGRREAMLRNFDFFGAPVGMFFAMDRVMTQGAWLDAGMFMQGVMMAASACGLATCAQQAWCDVGNVVHRELAIPDTHILLSGMAIGRPDITAPENMLETERAAVDDFTTWHR
jgi:nitroreductase